MKNFKKIVILVSILTFAFSLSSCGSKKNVKPNFDYDESELVQTVVQITEEFAKLSDDDHKQLESQLKSSATQDERYENYLSALSSVDSTKEECGEYVGFVKDKNDKEKYKIETDKDNVTITMTAKFEKKSKKRNVKIKFVVEEGNDGNAQISSMTYEPVYSIGEKMGKAGLNTLMGMGIVFTILIFLSLFISLFKYVDGIVAGLSKIKNIFVRGNKKKVSDNKENANSHDSANLADDTELVAVITAAIAHMNAETGASGDGFVVRSIRRVSGSKWNKR